MSEDETRPPAARNADAFATDRPDSDAHEGGNERRV
jgi:hypothetical protein